MLMKPLKQQYNESYIVKPNLPQGEVTCAAISERAGESSVKKLASLDIKTVKIPKYDLLPEPVCDHPDIQLLHLGNNIIFTCAEHLYVGDLRKHFDIRRIKEECSDKYPGDVLLNCSLIGKHLICNERTVAAEVLEFAEKNNNTIINVNQGYARCSVAVINENAIITDDISIFTAAQFFLNDVLFISKGSIRLDGYNYGFIGGCCGKIAKDKIAFNGRLDSHSDCEKIKSFLYKHNIEYVELSDGVLTDIGGIIPLKERIC